MAERTLIRASWVVGFDGRQHRIIRDGVVVYEGNTITHVGRRFDGQADRVIDAAGKVVTPGLISTHAHLAGSPLDKSFIEDRGSPQFYMSGLYEYLPVRSAAQDEEASRACVDFSLVELIRTGCTTVCELGSHTEYVAEQAERVGIRVYIGPFYRSGRWFTPDGKQVLYQWDEGDGFAGLRRALEIIDRWDGRANGRIRGLLSPGQADTCSEALLRETRRLATERRLPVTIHVSQSVIEFQEVLRRHGKTPIAWLRDLGFLGPDVILGHAIIIGGSSWTNYPPGDIEIMAETGVSVAHSPWVFYRRGIALESFTRYLKAGINISLGTDTCPQSMINAMRWAACVGKLVDRNANVATAAEVFDAATLGGARALGRDDLGRIAPGARADLVIWDAGTVTMSPVRDPIKNIVYSAETHDVETVIIDGEIVMANRRVLRAADERTLAERLQAAGERMWPRMKDYDWAGRTADELSPPSYPWWEGP